MAAGVVLAPKGHGFEQDCRLCHDPEKRARWGCDVPAPESFGVTTPCPFCGGVDPKCEDCHGTNEWHLHVCPHKMTTARDLDLVMLAQHAEQGRLPDAGGMMDQAATFGAALPVLLREIGAWRQKAMRVELDRQKAQQRARGGR